MNILIIENSIDFTGAFRCALNEALLLSGKHRFVFVIHTNSKVAPLLQEKGIKYYTLPMLEVRKSVGVMIRYPFRLLGNALKLKKIIRKEQIDVVQANDFYNLLGAALKILGYKGKLLTYVRFVPATIPAPFRKIWVTAAQKYADTVIAVSDTVLNQLPYKENTIRIYDPANLSETISKSQPATGVIQLLYLSNYIRGKGQDYALEAFIKAYQQNPALRLKFVGGDMGLEKNKLFRKLLEEKVQSLGLEHIVTFASFSKHIEQEIKQADIVLNFSNAESLSMTCLEAAYYGTALIATRSGGPEEIIKDKETGLLVPVADVDAMAHAILTLSNNESLRAQYATAGKAYVKEKFSTAHFITCFENVLNPS